MKSIFSLVIGLALGAAGAVALVKRPTPAEIVPVEEPFERGAACDSLSYLETAKKVEKFRVERRRSAAEFARLAAEPGSVVLDARGEAYFRALHVKGAVNLPYTDFREAALKKAIPDKSARVLIYCRNNFANEPLDIGAVPGAGTELPESQSAGSPEPETVADFPVSPSTAEEGAGGRKKGEVIRKFVYPSEFEPPEIAKDFAAGLNIPTFVTLWVYGYENVVELNDVVDPAACPIEFEGTAVR